MTKSEVFNKLPKTLSPDAKILLLTHTDADGAGATVILKSIFKDVTVKHCSNNTMSYEIKNAVTEMEIADNYDYIIACDISLNAVDAECVNMTSDKKKLIVLDHHPTAIGLNKYKFACIHPELIEDSFRAEKFKAAGNMNGLSSGTSLMYDYMDHIGLINNVPNLPLLQKMIHLIASYDTWDWFTIFNKEPIYNDFQSLCDIYGIDLYEESLIKKINEFDRTDVFNDTDRLLLKIEDTKIKFHIDSIKKYIVRANINMPFDNTRKDYDCVYVYANKYLQETFEYMKTTYPDVDLYIINYGSGLSFRAMKPEVNVGAIVSQYHGGGHPGAGGFKIPFNEQKAHMERILNATITISK